MQKMILDYLENYLWSYMKNLVTIFGLYVCILYIYSNLYTLGLDSRGFPQQYKKEEYMQVKRQYQNMKLEKLSYNRKINYTRKINYCTL